MPKSNQTPIISLVDQESVPALHRVGVDAASLPYIIYPPYPSQKQTRYHTSKRRSVSKQTPYLRFDLLRGTSIRSRRLTVVGRRQVYHIISAHRQTQRPRVGGQFAKGLAQLAQTVHTGVCFQNIVEEAFLRTQNSSVQQRSSAGKSLFALVIDYCALSLPSGALPPQI